MGNCCAHLGRRRSIVKVARAALRQVRRPADHRRGEDRLPRRQGRRAVAVRRRRRHLHLRQGDGQRLSDRRRRRARRDHAHLPPWRGRMAAPIPRIRCRWPLPRSASQILDETTRWSGIAAYGGRMKAGMQRRSSIARGIVHSFTGHPSMFGLFFARSRRSNYRDWKTSDYTLLRHDGPHLHDLGIICEPDSREPWFMCEAHDEELPLGHAERRRGGRGRSPAGLVPTRASPRPRRQLTRLAMTTTPSSSAPATTASSPPAISPAPG